MNRKQVTVFQHWWKTVQIQKVRLGVANFSIYLSQAFSLVTCVYVGAGSQHVSLWLNLSTSLLGVIIGQEMARLLALHKFYSANVSVEDVNEIDLVSSQELLSTYRRYIALVGCLNFLQVLFRLVVLGNFGFRNEEFLNVTSAINEEFPNLGKDLGLIECAVDCGIVGNTTQIVNLKLDCMDRCQISQDMFCGLLGMTGFLQISAFLLARLIVYGRIN